MQRLLARGQALRSPGLGRNLLPTKVYYISSRHREQRACGMVLRVSSEDLLGPVVWVGGPAALTLRHTPVWIPPQISHSLTWAKGWDPRENQGELLSLTPTSAREKSSFTRPAEPDSLDASSQGSHLPSECWVSQAWRPVTQGAPEQGTRGGGPCWLQTPAGVGWSWGRWCPGMVGLGMEGDYILHPHGVLSEKSHTHTHTHTHTVQDSPWR